MKSFSIKNNLIFLVAATIFLGIGCARSITNNEQSSIEPIIAGSPAEQSFSNDIYSFKYKGVIDQVLSPPDVVLYPEEGAHWELEIAVSTSTQKESFETNVNRFLSNRGWNVGNKIVKNYSIDGYPAYKLSINNIGDYGNAFVIIVTPKNVVGIFGDDSNESNRTIFNNFVKNFHIAPVQQ